MREIKWNILYPDGKTKIRLPSRPRGRDDDQNQLLKFLRNVTPKTPRKKKQPRAANGGKSAGDRRQRVMVKMMYGNDKAAHQKFLKEYMSQENKKGVDEKPEIFCREGNVTDYESRMTGRHFKLIVSPESQDVPMEQFVRTYMEKVSAELGVKFDWAAAVHNDTGHRHAHILINGKDTDGRMLKRPFPKDFVRHRAREIARNIATSSVGLRSKKEMTEAFERSIASNRWTVHDQKIAEMSGKGNAIMAHSAGNDTKRRLDHLVKIGIAELSKGRYTLEKNWDETLRITGRYNSFLSARETLKNTSMTELRLWNGDEASVIGTVRKRFCLNDEFVNDNAIVIENEKGAWFVPLFAPPKDGIEGSVVTVSAKRGSKGRVSAEIKQDTPKTKVNRNEARASR